MRPYRSVAPWRTLFLAVVVLAGAMPLARAAVTPDGAGKKGRYVVLLDDAEADAGDVARSQAKKLGFDVGGVFGRALKGYTGTMTPGMANALARMPGVKAVAPDAKMSTFATQPANGLWGLDRIDQVSRPLNGWFNYNMTGEGVTAYVVDTGVKAAHTQFGGRVRTAKEDRWDAYRTVADPAYGEDCDGHGTHVAGTVGGETYGVAKQVSIVSVRVLDCQGSGFVSDIVEGIEWMIGHHTGGPAVANMSFGGSRNSALDAAVAMAVNDGITVSVAAGNSGRDACNYSPGRAGSAVTVGATDSGDRRTSWSNYGSCLDIFAPGNGILSANGGSSSNSASTTMSGTSMAAPHVAGVAALLLSAKPDVGPAAIRDALIQVASSNKVTSARTSNPKLLYSPSDLVSGQLPQAAPVVTTTTATTTTTTRPPTTTTTRRCWILCNRSR